MAFLFDVAAGTCFPLASHHTFGRLTDRVDTHDDRPCVSKLHAVIEWTGDHWLLKNLGLNGTWVNDAWVAQGQSRELALLDSIRLADAAGTGFEVRDLTPPAPMLWPVDKELPVVPVYLSDCHLLPNAAIPEVAIFFEQHQRQWFIERGVAVEPQTLLLAHGDLIDINRKTWRFIDARTHSATELRVQPVYQLADFEFVFSLSLDEESTQLELVSQTHTIDLAARSHHYLLVQLARHRAADAAIGLDNKSQGWIYSEQLAGELGLDVTHMNIQIFRARKQLADTLTGLAGYQQLFERRGGKIRFGANRFRIYKGETLICALPALTASDAVAEL